MPLLLLLAEIWVLRMEVDDLDGGMKQQLQAAVLPGRQALPEAQRAGCAQHTAKTFHSAQ